MKRRALGTFSVIAVVLSLFAAGTLIVPGQLRTPESAVGEGSNNPDDAALRSALLKTRVSQMYAVADFNEDQLPDVASVDFVNDVVRVMLADASGRYRLASTLSAESGPRSIVAADFDKDGFIDLAVAEFRSG